MLHDRLSLPQESSDDESDEKESEAEDVEEEEEDEDEDEPEDVSSNLFTHRSPLAARSTYDACLFLTPVIANVMVSILRSLRLPSMRVST